MVNDKIENMYFWVSPLTCDYFMLRRWTLKIQNVGRSWEQAKGIEGKTSQKLRDEITISMVKMRHISKITIGLTRSKLRQF